MIVLYAVISDLCFIMNEVFCITVVNFPVKQV